MYKRVLTIISFLIVFASASAKTIYVKATGGSDAFAGTSWATAYQTLYKALSVAVSGDVIWVARGTYYPATPVTGSSSFVMKAGVGIYGGFAGTETTITDRDTSATALQTTNASILDGNGISYHVVLNSALTLTSTACLDGFTIQGGNTLKGALAPNYYGGGILNLNSGTPIFRNLVIQNCSAERGGGVYNSGAGAGPTFSKVKIFNNSAASAVAGGGGMFNTGYASLLTDVYFGNNTTAGYGGGLYNEGTPITLDRVSFVQNVATQRGGGMYNTYAAKLDNVVFSQNSVTTNNANSVGGGMYSASTGTVMNNITFSNNKIAYAVTSATTYGAAIYTTNAISIYNSIFWGNTRGLNFPDQLNSTGTVPTVTNAIVEGGFAVAGATKIIDYNPFFVNAAANDLRLGEGSVAIDGGDGTLGGGVKAADLANTTRIFNSIVDLGAYEAPSIPVSIQQTTLNNISRGQNTQQQLTSTGIGSPTWSVVGGALPNGVTLSASGLVGGTSMLTGTYPVVISVAIGAKVSTKAYFVVVVAGVARIYVNAASVSGSKSGVDWANAYTDLQSAIANSSSGDSIWVAKGTYTPGTLVTSAFSMKSGVKMYGGFAGTESSVTQRDTSKLPFVNETILSGSLQGNINSYHVVYNTTALTSATLLDGFTIQAGKTLTGSSGDNYQGAGIYNNNVSAQAYFRNLVVQNNNAERGAGIYNVASQAVFSRMLIQNNTSTLAGGGMNNTGASIILTDVVFKKNTGSGGGGGLYSTGISTLDMCKFIQNSAAGPGGGFFTSVKTTVTNSVFSGNKITIANSGTNGAGVYNGATSSFTNVTFSNNSTLYVAASGNVGAGLLNVNGVSSIDNCIFWGNTRGNGILDQLNQGVVNNSLVQGGFLGGTKIFIGNPQFVDAANDDVHLKAGSSAINVGDNNKITGFTKDADTLTRIVGNTVDLGAYEVVNNNSILLNPTSFASPTRGVVFTTTLTTAANYGQLTWSLDAGTLPAGMTFSNQGVLSGFPTQAGNFSIVVQVTNGTLTSQKQIDLAIAPAKMRLYVNVNAVSGKNNGGSWTDGMTDLKAALRLVTANDTVWVAHGTYSPEAVKDSSFQLVSGVQMFGGFSGSETALKERDSLKVRTVNETILDGKGFNYHVIFNNAALSATTLLDGFTIKGGHTLNGSAGDNYYGAGIYNKHTSVTAVFRNLVITNNVAEAGGGIYNNGLSVKFDNVVISNNTAAGAGGGFYNSNNSVVSLVKVDFKNNASGSSGGGFYNFTGTITSGDRLSFVGNTAARGGGGLYLNSGSAAFTNSIFSQNKVTTVNYFGGAIYQAPGVSLTLTNTSFSNNIIVHVQVTTSSLGGALFTSGSTTINNTIFWGNMRGNGVADQLNPGATVKTSIIQGGYTGTGVLSQDPLFLDANNDDLTPMTGSPAIDQGNGSLLNSAFVLDYFDTTRVVDVLDIGAVESQGGNNLKIKPNTLSALTRGVMVSINLSVIGGAAPYTWTIASGALPFGLKLSNTGIIYGVPMVAATTDVLIQVKSDTMIGKRAYSITVNPGPAKIYVSQSAAGDNFGSSWTDAFTSLTTAMSYAVGNDSMWVAKGNYSPGATATSTFTLIKDLKMFGGFAGTEKYFSDRDTSLIRTTNAAVLNGNKLSYHVVYCNSSTVSTATQLDGFTITGGKTLNSGATPDYFGGGVYIGAGNPTLSNLVIQDNAGFNGGGMYIVSAPVVSNVRLIQNKAGQRGGAICNLAAAKFFDVYMEGNTTTGTGGGMYNSGSATINRAWFIGNTADQHGGGYYHTTGTTTITNAVFSNNQVTSAPTSTFNGGAVYSYSGNLTLQHISASNNRIALVNNATTQSFGGAVYKNAGSLIISNSILWHNYRGGGIADQLNTVNAVYNAIIEGGYSGTDSQTVIKDDPQFVNAATNDLSLTGCSPAVNAVNPAKATPDAVDIFTTARNIQNADLGAIEYTGNKITIAATTLASGTRGVPYSFQFSSSGGNGTLVYSVNSTDTLPEGLSLSSDGLLSGRPLKPGTRNFTVRVTDGTLCGNAKFQLTINKGTGGFRIYVNASAVTGQNNGSNWQNGYLSLTRALSVSIPMDSVFVAKGTYSPGNTVASSFTLPDSVVIIGGFAGNEMYFSDRDTSKVHTVNESILSGGNINYHVIYNNVKLHIQTELVGFTISGGRAQNASNGSANTLGGGFYNMSGMPTLTDVIFKDNFAYQGGAIYNAASGVNGGSLIMNKVTFIGNVAKGYGGAFVNTGTQSNPKFIKVIFQSNSAELYGGAVYCTGGKPDFTDVQFIGNASTTAGYSGGGMYDLASSTLTNVQFVGNTAYMGAGLFTQSNTTINGAVFRQNRASYMGGAVYTQVGNIVLNNAWFIDNNATTSNGGALYVVSGSAKLNNAVFSRNAVLGNTYGGGIFTAGGITTITNSTFSGNTSAYTGSTVMGAAVFKNGGTINIYNSIFWNNKHGVNNTPDQLNTGITVANSIVQGGYTGTKVINVDPQFKNATIDSIAVVGCSPAVGYGDNTKVTLAGIAKDILGNNRILDITVDLGAVEYAFDKILFTTDSILIPGKRGRAYSLQLGVSQQMGVPVYSLRTGDSLPSGMKLSNSGLISGRPMRSGTFRFTVDVTDNTQCGSKLFRVDIDTGTVHFYVDGTAASGAKDGSSWQDAFTDLQDAIWFSIPKDSIWVAKGMYSPGTLVTSSYILKDNVKILGGFKGTEGVIEERDTARLHDINETILSGAATGAKTVPSYHVVYNTSTLSASTLLDGFTISGGMTMSYNASNISPNYVGGGIYNASASGSPTFRNLIIKNNVAVNGGGLYNTGAPTLIDVQFLSDTARIANGGAIYNTGAPKLMRVKITGNLAGNLGGAIYSAGNMQMDSCVVASNSASGGGGGVYFLSGSPQINSTVIRDNIVSGNYYGGGMYINSSCTPILSGVSFIANSSGSNGGGLFNQGSPMMYNIVFSRNKVTSSSQTYGGGMYTSAGVIAIRYATFSNNTVAYSSGSTVGAGFYRQGTGGSLSIENSIFWKNTRGGGVSDQLNISGTSIGHSIVEGWTDTSGTVVNKDPYFVDAAIDSLSIKECSSAINTGDMNAAPSSVVTDISGRPRIMYGQADMGAYEFQGLAQTAVVLQDAKKWTPYNFKILPPDSANIYSYEKVCGAFPDGLQMAADGTISGTPTSIGIAEFSIRMRSPAKCVIVPYTLTVQDGKPIIKKVLYQNVAPVKVELGVTFGNLPLPQTVDVELTDLTVATLPVVWNPGSYDGNVSGVYPLVGNLTPLAYPEQNPNNLVDSINVVVIDGVIRFISSVKQSDPIAVIAGTEFSALSLPPQAEVTYSDGTKEMLNVNWDPAGYSPNAGVSRLQGHLLLTPNAENPGNQVALIDVNVMRNITSVEQFDPLKVKLHTTTGELTLPSTVKVGFNDGVNGTLSVSWDISSFNGDQFGKYQIYGTLILPAGAINATPLTPVIEVDVLKNVISVDGVPSLDVAYGTAFNQLSLPTSVTAQFDDGTSANLSVEWQQGSYDETNSDTYQVKGELLLGDDQLNLDLVMAAITVIVGVKPSEVIAVDVIPIYVPFGTPLSTVISQMPMTQTVFLDDVSFSNRAVMNVSGWGLSLYDPHKAGVYEALGTIELTTGIANPWSVRAHVNVVVRNKTVVSIDAPQPTNANYGTLFPAISFPPKVVVHYNDGSTEDVSVTWSPGNYDEHQVGPQDIFGLVNLAPEVDNPNDLQPKTVVNVGAPLPNIDSVESGLKLSVAFGTPTGQLNLPQTVLVYLDNQTTMQLPVQWGVNQYYGNIPGDYQFSGTLQLPGTITNNGNVTATITVTVNKKLVTGVDVLADMNVVYGTAFDDIGVPQKIGVTYSDNSYEQLNVFWDQSAYTPTLLALQPITGGLELPSDANNLSAFLARINLNVLKKLLSFDSIPDKQLTYGAVFTDLNLPATLNAHFNDGSFQSMPITWNPADFNTASAGTFDILGGMQLDATSWNKDNIFPKAKIVLDKAILTIAVVDTSRLYGGSISAYRMTYSGFVKNENASVLTQTPVIFGAPDNTFPVKTYKIVASGAVATNYQFNYVDGILTINPAKLTAKVNDASRPYGNANPVFTFTYSGFVNNEGPEVVNVEPAATTLADKNSPVGQYLVSCASGTAYNYYFEYQTGFLNITGAVLNIIAEHKIRKIGESNPPLTYTVEGLQNGEDESIITTQPSISTTASIGSAIGSYPITITGAVAPNYTFTYTGGVMNVTPLPGAALQNSGSISVFEIADYMLSNGEISNAERQAQLSIDFLKSKSHLLNKLPPHSLSDWYGYGPGNKTATLVSYGLRHLTASTVDCGGFINDDNGSVVTERGICWSTNPNPTVNDNKVVSGSGTGNYSINLTGLVAGQTYFIRAYATNSAGTAYGNVVSCTPKLIIP